MNIDSGANLETAVIATVGAGGSTTAAVASSAGDTNLKIASVSGIAAGNTLWIDAGANLETAVVASVGTGGNTTLSAATDIGATNIKIGSTSGLNPNGAITIDSGANAETATIYQVGGSGTGGTGINLYAPLTKAHASGAIITGSGVNFTAPLSKAHAAGVPVTGLGLTFTAPLTKSHLGNAVAVATLTAAGATSFPVVSVSDFAVGQAISIDPSGTNPETATIAAVGTPGPTGTGITIAASARVRAHGCRYRAHHDADGHR